MSVSTKARTDMWKRYREVFEDAPSARQLDIDALIDMWSQMWFLPDEVAGWLARGIVCPAKASKLRIEELRVTARRTSAASPPPRSEHEESEAHEQDHEEDAT